MPSNITVRLPKLEELDAYASEQWENYVFFLTFDRDDKEPPKLTESGFQFLLMDTNAQLWYIIREYITNAEESGVDSADLIAFLLELSFHVAGEVPYSS
nr:RNA polymerase II transcription factor B subunit 2-like isoform X1 [Ipomoea batatas]